MIKAEMMATKGSHLQVFEYMQLFQFAGFEDTPERGCEEGKIPMSDVQPWSLPRFRFNPSFSLVVSCKILPCTSFTLPEPRKEVKKLHPEIEIVDCNICDCFPNGNSKSPQ